MKKSSKRPAIRRAKTKEVPVNQFEEMTQAEAAAPTSAVDDPVFGADPEESESTKSIRKKTTEITRGSNPRMFEPTQQELEADLRREHDRQVGLLIGPKNLERMRAFGFDYTKVSESALNPGIAHRGMTE